MGARHITHTLYILLNLMLSSQVAWVSSICIQGKWEKTQRDPWTFPSFQWFVKLVSQAFWILRGLFSPSNHAQPVHLGSTPGCCCPTPVTCLGFRSRHKPTLGSDTLVSFATLDIITVSGCKVLSGALILKAWIKSLPTPGIQEFTFEEYWPSAYSADGHCSHQCPGHSSEWNKVSAQISHCREAKRQQASSEWWDVFPLHPNLLRDFNMVSTRISIWAMFSLWENLSSVLHFCLRRPFRVC